MVNQVVLVGRITRDLELKATSNGREVVSFSLAVNRNFKNANGEYDADFINCVAFGQQARFMDTYLGKGRLISVVGRLNTRNYENNVGQRVYVTEVIVEQVNPLDSAQNRTNNVNNYDGGFSQPTAPVTNNVASNPTPSEPTPYDFMNLEEVDESDLPF